MLFPKHGGAYGPPVWEITYILSIVFSLIIRSVEHRNFEVVLKIGRSDVILKGSIIDGVYMRVFYFNELSYY